MAVFLVSYDLNKQGQNYTNLINAIKTYDAYIKCLHSQWLISTNDNISFVHEYLKSKIDNNDLLLITPIVQPFYATLRSDVISWLKNELDLGHIPTI